MSDMIERQLQAEVEKWTKVLDSYRLAKGVSASAPRPVPARRAKLSTRAAVLAVLSPQEWIQTKDLPALMHAAGWRSKARNSRPMVSVMLSTLKREGVVVRNPNGRGWSVPTTHNVQGV